MINDKIKIQSQRNEIERLIEEVKMLREQHFVRFANDECWIYQGDGEDHLESLVCPVVISAQKLIELGG